MLDNADACHWFAASFLPLTIIRKAHSKVIDSPQAIACYPRGYLVSLTLLEAPLQHCQYHSAYPFPICLSLSLSCFFNPAFVCFLLRLCPPFGQADVLYITSQLFVISFHLPVWKHFVHKGSSRNHPHRCCLYNNNDDKVFIYSVTFIEPLSTFLGRSMNGAVSLKIEMQISVKENDQSHQKDGKHS